MSDAAGTFDYDAQEIGLALDIVGRLLVLFCLLAEPTDHDPAVGSSAAEHDLTAGE